MKLESQFVIPETLIAAGKGPWENSSATMNHGIGPKNKKKGKNRLKLQMKSQEKMALVF